MVWVETRHPERVDPASCASRGAALWLAPDALGYGSYLSEGEGERPKRARGAWASLEPTVSLVGGDSAEFQSISATRCVVMKVHE
jgi:hypothetical protein